MPIQQKHPIEAAFELMNSPWEPPKNLLSWLPERLPAEDWVPLMVVVNLLAFGTSAPPADLSGLIEAAEKTRAARAVFEAAKKGRVKLSGRQELEGTLRLMGSIQFTVPMKLHANIDNMIERDFEKASVEEYAQSRLDRYQPPNPSPFRWADVSVERASLLEWATQQGQEAVSLAEEKASRSFNDADWSLDQALIWIATRRADLVNEASDDPFVPPDKRLRWVALLLRDDMSGVPSTDIERQLLQAIKRGDVQTTVDGGKVDPRLYSAAQYVRGLDGTVFHWTEQTPFLVNFFEGDARHERRHQHELRPRLEIADLVGLYPDPAIEPQSVSESSSNVQRAGASGKIRQPLSQPKQYHGAKSRGIRMAVDTLWPNGIPSGLSVKDRDREIVGWLKANGHSIPSSRSLRRILNE